MFSRQTIISRQTIKRVLIVLIHVQKNVISERKLCSNSS